MIPLTRTTWVDNGFSLFSLPFPRHFRDMLGIEEYRPLVFPAGVHVLVQPSEQDLGECTKRFR